MTLDDREWMTIRDFESGDTGCPFPKFEAKYVEQVDQQYVEDDLVLIKETNAATGGERLHHIPRDVFERVIDRLPE
jgi:hypothetical protein